jgi:putative transposase
MKRKRFTEEQIITILKEHDLGMKMADIVRKHNVSEQSVYRWKSRFGGMDVGDAKKLKQLEAENAKLKKLLAETMLEKVALEDVLSKEW